MPNVDTSKKFDSVALYRIRKLLSDLANKTGRGTELVSLYLPPKKAIHEAIAALREESGTASNIKSDVTRKHVEDALTKTMARLRLYKQTPENGLIIFCGAIPGPGGPGNETIDLYEVLPQKPVTTYLYRCLAPETKVLLQNGLYRTLDELRLEWKNTRIKSTTRNGEDLTETKITDYAATIAGFRRVLRLTSESGRALVGTEDHPLYTPKGWKKLGELKPGELVSVYPADDLEIAIQKNASVPSDLVLADEKMIRSLVYPTENTEIVLRQLRALGLLPMKPDNAKLPTLARLLGHLFSDQTFTSSLETRSENPNSHFGIDICLGDEESIEQISADIRSLGCSVAKPYKSVHKMVVDGRAYTTATFHTKICDTALCSLLQVLGAPVGSKVRNGTTLPSWLLQSPALVQREFLAAYQGGDGDSPRMQESDPAGAVRVVFHRIERLRDQGLNFARHLSLLFENLGVKISSIDIKEGCARQDGLKTVEIVLQFVLSEDNLLRICHSIGYRYSNRKIHSALLVGEYLRIKSHARKKTNLKLKTTIQMLERGQSATQIALTVGLENRTKAWTSGKITSPIMRSNSIPGFNDWLSISNHGSGQLLVWESIESVEEVHNFQDVRDITVESPDHSFFANGFMVHNCDDHFHLEPLRDMLREQNVIGILSLDATEAGLGIVSGDSWEVVDTMSSGVSGKTRKGGQSARRYERLREMELTDYFNRLADHSKIAFLDQYQIKGLIVSGPGPTKDEFVKDKYLDYRLQNLIVGTLDSGYAGREGVRETIEKSGKLLENVRVVEEKKLVQRFFREINSDTGLGIYGIKDIVEALKKSSVDTIIVNDDTDTIYLKASCNKCGNVEERFVTRSQIVTEKQNLLTCSKCGSTEIEISERDIVDYLADLAIDSGANVEVISSKTEDGAMMKSFGGISAILRYRA